MEAVDKNYYRKYMKNLRSSLSDKDRHSYNNCILERFLDLECVKDSKWIYSFVSYGTEVDTLNIIKRCLDKGKRIAVPKVNGKIMEFFEITAISDLKSGYRGILEPVGNNCIIADNGVMLIPGLAFDCQHNRIGYGGGYYDKYLYKYDNKKLIKVAIAYDFQVVRKFKGTFEEYDIRPDFIITDKKIY